MKRGDVKYSQDLRWATGTPMPSEDFFGDEGVLYVGTSKDAVWLSHRRRGRWRR